MKNYTSLGLLVLAISLMVSFKFDARYAYSNAVGSLDFTSSLPMHYEFADQPGLPEGFGAGVDLSFFSGEIATIVESALSRGDLTGASVTVLKGDTPVHSRGYGMADLENRVQASGETRYNIGSITKTFTAAAIMQLVERGHLNLDDVISDIIPELNDAEPPVLIRHLLSHTSGLAGPQQVISRFIDRRHLEFSRAQLLELLQDEPRVSSPGEKFAYNNLGYNVLGIVVERVSGKSFESYLREDLLAPESVMLCDSRRIIPHRAKGYVFQNGDQVHHELVNASLVFAAGGLCANADDVAAWFRALAAGEIVSPESFDQMAAPTKLSNNSTSQYGFGLFSDTLAGHRRIYHSGVVNGFAGHAVFYPELDVTVVILTNTRSDAYKFIDQQIAQRIAVLSGQLPPPAHTTSVGSLNFTSSLPMHYEFADQPALPEGFGAGEFTMELWIKPDHTYPIGETWRGSYDQLNNWSESDPRPYSSHGWWYEGNWLLDGHTRPEGFDAFDTREGTFSLQFYGGGRVRWTFADDDLEKPGKVYAVQAYPSSTAPSLLDGEWHHIACVRRWAEDGGAILELWVDGQLIAETSIPKRVDMTTFWHKLPHPNNPSELGGWSWGAEVMTAWKTVFTQYEDYKGLMDELRFWNRALTHDELENDWKRAVKGNEPGLIGWYDFTEVKENAFYDRLNPNQRIELHHFGKENLSSESAPID